MCIRDRIFVNTAASVLVPDTQIANFCAFIGSPLAALFTGCILSLLLDVYKRQVRISAPKNFSISSVWFLEIWGSVTRVSPSA